MWPLAPLQVPLRELRLARQLRRRPAAILPVYYGGVNYAYYGGYYYRPAATGYVVVKPPLGAIVPTLPPGATATTVNGQTYFVYNDTYYKPVLVNGATGYQVVQL